MKKTDQSEKELSEIDMHNRIAELESELQELRRSMAQKSKQDEILKYRLELNELSLSESIENIITSVADAAEKLTQSKIGFLHFYDEDTETLALQSWSTNTLLNCKAAATDEFYSTEDAGVWVNCIRERKPVIINDYATVPGKKGIPKGHVIVTRQLTVPIFREERLVAVLGVGNRDWDYDQNDIEDLSQFANIAWEIIVNRRLNIELERKEDRHNALLETMFEGVTLNELVFNDQNEVVDYRILEANSALNRYSGITKASDIIGKKASEVYGIDQEYMRKFWNENYFNDKPVVTDYYHSANDQWIRVSTSPLKNYKFTAVFFDTTDSKKAEEFRKKEEHRYRKIIETSLDGFWVVDANCRIIEVNNTYCVLSGYSREEINGSPISNFIFRGEQADIRERRDKILSNVTDIFESIHRKKDGTLWNVEVNATSAGEGGLLYVFLKDITRKKETEKEKEITIKLLSHINETNNISDLIKKTISVFREISGCEAVSVRYKENEDIPYTNASGFPEKIMLAEKFLCQHDCSGQIVRDAHGDQVLDCMCGNIFRGRFNPELTFYTESGSFWTNSTTELLKNTDEDYRQARICNKCYGEGFESVALIPLRIGKETFGLLQLNDKRKGMFDLGRIHFFERQAAYISGALSHFENQEILVKNENRYRYISSLISNVAYTCRKKDGVFRFDWLAGSVMKIFGYTIEEMLSCGCWKNIVHSDDIQIFAENIEELASGCKSDCELRIIMKDGSVRWINSVAESLDNGEILYGAIIDINEDKIKEESLRIIHENLEEAQHLAKIGSWEYIVDSEEFKCSRETRLIFGKDCTDQGTDTLEEYVALVSADAISELERKALMIISGETGKITQEIRIQKSEGVILWILLIGTARYEKGKMISIKGTIQDITERKKAEEALNHSHDLMSYIIEHNRSAVAVHDRDLNYIYVSQRYLSDYNLSGKDIIGKHHYDVFPDLPQKWRNAHQEALKGRILSEEDDIYEKDDGTIEWTRWECRPWYQADKSIGGIIVYTEVISDRKRIELNLKNSEMQLNAMFNNAPVIMILLNENCEVLKMNKFGMEATGRNMESLTGLKPGDVMRCINSHINEGGCGNSPFCRSCVLRKSINETFTTGSEFYKIEAELCTVNEDVLKTHTIVISTSVISSLPQKQVLITIDDITSGKELEKELIKARDKAEESDRLKSAFLANISHEIRTPMNGIMGFSDMLTKQGLSDEKRNQFSALVHDGCRQLLSIITDVIDISMLDSEQMSIVKTDFRIDEFLQDIFLLFRSPAGTKELKLSFVKGNRNDSIITDREKLTHIFTNLLSNAVKFTKEGSIEYGYSLKSDCIEFFVSDTGIGIHPELHDAIFERFRQAETSDTRNYGGTGLGLSIAKGLVALLGGRIWLKSEPGRGTTFFFSIPSSGISGVLEDAPESEPGNKILIAEDDDINYLFIQEVLLDINCTPYHARNGSEALEILKEHPDVMLVFMDIKMPVMDGYTATLEIKKMNPSIPVYALTAYTLPTDPEELKKSGFSGFISKPIDKSKFELIIGEHIRLINN
jgi:PAS domain S-box-containing protein